VQINWSPRALQNLRHIRSYIARDNPAAARAVAQAIEDQANRLSRHPRRGTARPGGFREIVEPRYRYVVRYDLMPDDTAPMRVHILAIWHPKQAR
jgi:plasmid stabilization system protein ParE